MRALVAPPAHMHADTISRDIAQRMVDRIDDAIAEVEKLQRPPL